eukprot:2018826-Pyramimonas_sp.AAC.1
MGFPYARMDPDTKIVKYMHFKQQYKEAFRTRFEMKKSQGTAPDVPAPAPRTEPGGGSPAPPPRPAPRPKSESAEALANAVKHIRELNVKVMSATQILDSTKSGKGDW